MADQVGIDTCGEIETGPQPEGASKAVAQTAAEEPQEPPGALCERRLNRIESAVETRFDAALDAFFAFFDRLFSEQGRVVRRVVYSWISVFILIYVIAHTYEALARLWHAATAQWFRLSDHRWMTLGGGALVLILTVYHIWRRRQIRRGIKSPPWILITLIALGALGLSAAAGLLLYRFAPDQSSKFDAVKTALTMFAGAAGVGAVILSLRSHFTGETDRLNTQFDATAQKLTDKSAVVQTVGLLALQRSARRQPAYRNATAAVLLAYLAPAQDAEFSPGADALPKGANLAQAILDELT